MYCIFLIFKLYEVDRFLISLSEIQHFDFQVNNTILKITIRLVSVQFGNFFDYLSILTEIYYITLILQTEHVVVTDRIFVLYLQMGI